MCISTQTFANCIIRINFGIYISCKYYSSFARSSTSSDNTATFYEVSAFPRHSSKNTKMSIGTEADLQPANEFTLESPPNDTISSVNFSPTSANFLLVSSWDDVSCFCVKCIAQWICTHAQGRVESKLYSRFPHV